MLVLSIFPGADLLGRGFEAEGFCVVRGPDVVWGSDVRDFHPTPGAFAGVIGGSPCQDFSAARRAEPTGQGMEMLAQFARVVAEARPEWFLLENVPRVPDVIVPRYVVQRFNVTAAECGGRQNRLRCFQFGSRDGVSLVLDRGTARGSEPACMATEAGRKQRRSWADFCELQGLPRLFDLPGLSIAAKYRAVGNGVPVFVARVIARAVRKRHESRGRIVCVCGCGRAIEGRRTMATVACRKRMQRHRECAGPVGADGPTVTA